MKFFLDTAHIGEIEELIETGFVDGVTTNPSLVAVTGKSFESLLKDICKIVKGPVSAEVNTSTFKEMLQEGLKLSEIAPNIIIKVPLTADGLKTCRALVERKIGVNVTLCFSAAQALLAAKAGATYISPFIGRLDDQAQDGMTLIEEIRTIYDNYPDFNTQILAASIRHPLHVVESAKVGADVATMPAKILKQLYHHSLTTSGLEKFTEDWKKSQNK